jgi:hypothetical protein
VFSTELDGWDISPDGGGTHDWYPNGWFSQFLPTSDYSVDGGILDIHGDNSGYGWGLATAAPAGSAASSNYKGQVWQHAYFEASLAYSSTALGTGAWPAFWGWAVEGLTTSRTEWAEVDFYEAYRLNGGIYPIFTIHDWVADGGNFSNNGQNHAALPKGTSTDQFHTYGCLWVEGSVTWYFDNVEMVTQAWQPGATFSVTDSDQLIVILGTGQGWPMDVQWVHVWQ